MPSTHGGRPAIRGGQFAALDKHPALTHPHATRDVREVDMARPVFALLVVIGVILLLLLRVKWR